MAVTPTWLLNKGQEAGPGWARIPTCPSHCVALAWSLYLSEHVVPVVTEASNPERGEDWPLFLPKEEGPLKILQHPSP